MQARLRETAAGRRDANGMEERREGNNEGPKLREGSNFYKQDDCRAANSMP